MNIKYFANGHFGQYWDINVGKVSLHVAFYSRNVSYSAAFVRR